MSLEELKAALSSKRPEEIRNVCLIAHVDHGKTSLADSLVSSNAIISNRQAGQLRFMDSREDEQIRGITMKSSGISLLCGSLLVNLMDSPGHVDFSSEVASTLLVSDVAFLLVDAVEGVCSQTESLLRQAVENGQTVVLIINKLDRLCVELRMRPAEAYQQICDILTAVNSCISQVIGAMSLAEEETEQVKRIEELERRLHADPLRGNVLFSSAIHGYAFTPDDFAEIYAEKLKMDKAELAQYMYGDFGLERGTVKEGAQSRKKPTLFEQLILEPLWNMHECGLVKPDLPKLKEMAEKLKINGIRSRRAEDAFDELMKQWLPIARACFRAAARQPSAKLAYSQHFRMQRLLGRRDHPLYEAMTKCDKEGETVLAVVKFVHHEGEKLAICRVFSGQVKTGDELFVTGAKKLTAAGEEDGTAHLSTTVNRIYLLRGREYIPIEAATAGTICAIQAKNIVQNATLCSHDVTEGIDQHRGTDEPLVRVTINTAQIDQMDELRATLKVLAVLDPSVRVFELEDGELALVTAGEVHLQKCLKDLEDMGLADLQVSAPNVPFLETIIPDLLARSAEIEDRVVELRIRGEALYLRLRAVPLPYSIIRLLEENRETLQALWHGQIEPERQEVVEFRKHLHSVCRDKLPKMKGSWWHKKSEEEIDQLVDNIWCFGPLKAHANLLINAIPDYDRGSVFKKAPTALRPLEHLIVAGFQLFVGAGPLANEPMRGVAVVVEQWQVDETDAAVSGQLMSAMKAACRAATEKTGMIRLVAAMYRCSAWTNGQTLGKVYQVLAQRKAKILQEEFNEQSGKFEVEALLPVVESFSFSDNLRKATSGMASARLSSCKWEVIEEDPYWKPTTLEEIEEFGRKGDSPNHARGYMDAIRKRKGLPTEDLIVVSADKQRNLNKKK